MPKSVQQIEQVQPDPRIEKLKQFFDQYKCPAISYTLINDYLNAADQNNIDYRILPAISIEESGCGRHSPDGANNFLGWDSGRKRFATLHESIGFVAQQLGHGHYYAGKSLIKKLHAYNPNVEYAFKITGLMKEISNDPIDK